jgi:hypothetical protein
VKSGTFLIFSWAILPHAAHYLSDGCRSYNYNVLVLPSGNYRNILTDEAIEKISAWTRDGGTLITFGEANSILAAATDFCFSEKWQIQDRKSLHSMNFSSLMMSVPGEISSRTPGSCF